jgi:hypothetical protein
MAGKRWQGGKDGAMMKKRRFGRAVGFIFAPLSLFLLLLLLLSSSFQKETTNLFYPFLKNRVHLLRIFHMVLKDF